MLPPGDGGMGALICKHGNHEAKHESGNLRLRLSYSSMWSCSGSFCSENKAISGGRSCWCVGAQSTVGSSKSDPHNWAIERAVAETILSSRPGGLEWRGKFGESVKRGIEEITCHCGKVKSGLGYSVMSSSRLLEIEGAVKVNRSSSVSEAIKSSYISSSSRSSSLGSTSFPSFASRMWTDIALEKARHMPWKPNSWAWGKCMSGHRSIVVLISPFPGRCG